MVAVGAPPDVPLAQVKWRVDSKPFDGRARFLPYIDAYEAARLLDAWVGPENWSDAYEPAHGKGLYCHLSVRFGETWVTKTDVGVPSNMEAEKGLVSDAFKRACSLKWGVGGNVYRLPNVWAPVTTKTDKNGNPVAVPNAQTIPAIIGELKKMGFSDADAADATNDDHDEPSEDTTQKGAAADGAASDGDAASRSDGADSHDVGRTAPEAAPALASFDEMDWLRREVKALPSQDRNRLKKWAATTAKIPNFDEKDALTAAEFERVCSYLDELHEEREKREPGSTAKEIAERHAAPKGPADRAAGDAA